MTNFDSLRDLYLRLFGAPNLSAEHIVDIRVEDAANVSPHALSAVSAEVAPNPSKLP